MKRRWLAPFLLAACAFIAYGAWPSDAHADGSDDSRPALDDGPSDAGSDEVDEDDASDDESPKEEPKPASPFRAVAKEDLERALSSALDETSASFCRAKTVDPLGDPLLCSLSKEEVRQRCPGLKQACQINPKRDWRAPAWLGHLADLGFWALLAGLIGVLGLSIWRALGKARLERRATEPVPRAPSEEPARAPRRSGEGDVARLWAQAERAASASRFEEAVATLQAALIHALRISGKLHVSPALTNGDYLRALASEQSLHGPVREVFRAVEAVQFGGATANAELYRRVLERVQPIVTRALGALILGLLCFAQSSCGPGGWAGDFRTSARGLGVFTRVVSEQQTTVRRRLRSLESEEIEPEVATILVIGEQPSEVWSKLLRFTASGGTLIVTSESEEVESATHTHYLPGEYSGKLTLPPDFEPTRLELSAITAHALDLPTEQRGHDRSFALANGRPYVAERAYGIGQVIFFADEEFLSSASLSLGDNAFFVASLARAPGRVLELVGPWTGGGSKSTFSSLFKAGLGPLLAQLALLALLFGWHRGVHFGTPRDPASVERRAFRDHVLALGANYRRARATRFALATYGSWLIERLRDRLSPQQPIGLIDLAGRMSTRLGQPESELVLLLTETRDAQEDAALSKPSASDLSTLEKLESLTLRAGGSK